MRLFNLCFLYFYLISGIFRKYLELRGNLSKDNYADITGLLQKLNVNPTVRYFFKATITTTLIAKILLGVLFILDWIECKQRN